MFSRTGNHWRGVDFKVPKLCEATLTTISTIEIDLEVNVILVNHCIGFLIESFYETQPTAAQLAIPCYHSCSYKIILQYEARCCITRGLILKVHE